MSRSWNERWVRLDGGRVFATKAVRWYTPNLRRVGRWACIVGVGGGLSLVTARAENGSPELIRPPVCSPLKKMAAELQGQCEITRIDNKRHKVTAHLTAQTGAIQVGSYTVITENYNGTYLPPVVEAMPGDTVAARLVNVLAPRVTIDAPLDHRTQAAPHGHGPPDENPTNLHYFHGGIVTPRNSRSIDMDASKGTGDNVYVRLKNGFDAAGKPQTFEYSVPIPGEGELDGTVLEGKGMIAHPKGLNWYHSHMHGRSSDQVMGGLSGLLSIGEDKANVRAKCAGTPSSREKCDRDTAELKQRTTVRYALLRDIALREISALPEDVKATHKTARWAPEDRGFHPDIDKCLVWKKKESDGLDDPKLRRGFCQRSPDSAWLFTLNGQRFPTITIEGNSNLLLRLGNLSANVAYWLELKNEKNDTILPLTILSLDGVVPAKPVFPDGAGAIDAFEVQDLLLMPASRAEIYVRNDDKHADEQVYILRTKQLDAGTDVWPEIQLARIVLKPNKVASRIVLGRNAPTQQFRTTFAGALPAEASMPPGCVRDLEVGEHRRVTFRQGGEFDWSVATEIMRLKGANPSQGYDEDQDFESVKEARIGKFDGDKLVGGTAFEEYVTPDGGVNWLKLHVCIRLDNVSPPEQSGSYQQLWVLRNPTDSLHNFHIHQMKFRLATKKELKDRYHIIPKGPASTCPKKNCTGPDYRFYEEDGPGTAESYPLWHDTIPVPTGKSAVYLVMSFTAVEQIGRYVFHCHILKHEDKGLMAPIEVWARFPDLDQISR